MKHRVGRSATAEPCATLSTENYSTKAATTLQIQESDCGQIKKCVIVAMHGVQNQKMSFFQNYYITSV